MKFLFYTGFMAIFGTYGLGLVGFLGDPTLDPSFDKPQTQIEKSAGHYTLKAMR